MSMRPISEAASRIAGKSFSRKYIALGRIVSHWNEIVGEDLALKAQPVKIRYQKNDKIPGKKPEAALDIAVSSAEATLLHYQKDLILERINQIFGERWISAIRFVTMPANTVIKKARKAKSPLTDGQKNTLSGMLAGITDPEVKARLEELGKEIVTDTKS
jgi:hypothetical protein